MRSALIKGDTASAKPRCRPSLTPRRWRGRNPRSIYRMSNSRQLDRASSIGFCRLLDQVQTSTGGAIRISSWLSHHIQDASFYCGQNDASSNAGIKYLAVQPDVLETPAVIDTVDHDGQSTDRCLLAGGGDSVREDGPHGVFDQPGFDIPYDGLAVRNVSLAGLGGDERRKGGIAVAVEVARRAAAIVLGKMLIGIVERAAGGVDHQNVLLLVQAVEIDRAVDQLQFAVDVDVAQLVDHDYRQIAIGRDVACADLDLQALVRTVTRVAHQGPSLLARRLDIAAITGQVLQGGRADTPDASRRWQHRAADDVLPFARDVDEGLAVERQRQSRADPLVVERR